MRRADVTAAEIADAINDTLRREAQLAGTEFHPLTVRTVQTSLRRANLIFPHPRRTLPSCDVEIPWELTPEHSMAYPALMLRLMGRRRRAETLTDEETNAVDAWLAERAATRTVVGYSPTRGFRYLPENEGDHPEGPPIRRAELTAEMCADTATEPSPLEAAHDAAVNNHWQAWAEPDDASADEVVADD